MTPSEYYTSDKCPFCEYAAPERLVFCGCGTGYSNHNNCVKFKIDKYKFIIDLEANGTLIYDTCSFEIERYSSALIITQDNYLEQIERLKKLQVFR